MVVVASTLDGSVSGGGDGAQGWCVTPMTSPHRRATMTESWPTSPGLAAPTPPPLLRRLFLRPGAGLAHYEAVVVSYGGLCVYVVGVATPALGRAWSRTERTWV